MLEVAILLIKLVSQQKVIDGLLVYSVLVRLSHTIQQCNYLAQPMLNSSIIGIFMFCHVPLWNLSSLKMHSETCPMLLHTLYIPSYLFPSSGQYLLCLRPLQLRTTLTGLPSFQFLDSAPFLSLTGTLQLRARALVRATANNLNMQRVRWGKASKILLIKRPLWPRSFSVIPVHVGKCLITWLLCSPLISRQVSPSGTSVSELITIILEYKTNHIYYK